LPKFLHPSLPAVVREYVRQALVGLSNPATFPHIFQSRRDTHADRVLCLLPLFRRALLPFECMSAIDTTEEQLATSMFDIGTSGAFNILLNWLLRGNAHGFEGRAVASRGPPYIALLRRTLALARVDVRTADEVAKGLPRRALRTADELARDVGSSFVIFNALKGPLEVELSEIVRQTLRDPEVTSGALDECVRQLLRYHIFKLDERVLAMMRLLLSCGASTLVRDSAGFLLITNIRAGAIFGLFGPSEAGTSKSTTLTFKPNVQREMVNLISEYGANWTRLNHHLFPQEFRRRVFAFLLVNRRFRTAEKPWLPRDPLQIIFNMVATSDYCDEEQQLIETKALLTHIYGRETDRDLRHLCNAADTEKGHKSVRQFRDFPPDYKPFKSFCKQRKISVKLAQEQSREFFIEFLVALELGLLEGSDVASAAENK
jgi:hypothetical protein